MKKYCVDMANVFDGFRLDNFHNSNINAAQHFLNSAIKVNQNLFIVSELFFPDKKIKAELTEKTGMHRLVAEF